MLVGHPFLVGWAPDVAIYAYVYQRHLDVVTNYTLGGQFQCPGFGVSENGVGLK